MEEVTQNLKAINDGDPHAAAHLLPLVYDELRKLAAQKIAKERPGQTLDATALVHEAYIRLVGSEEELHWSSRRHFFAAAAEAMRRILIDNARRKLTCKRGGNRLREDLNSLQLAIPESNEDLVALDEALDKFSETDPKAAELVKLRYFAGLTGKQAAELLDISPRTADLWWSYARAWLLAELQQESDSSA